MIIISDNIDFGRNVFPGLSEWKKKSVSGSEPRLLPLAEKLFSSSSVYCADTAAGDFWKAAFMVSHAPCSHYDLMIDFSRVVRDIPSGILCMTGSSDSLHGQRGRPWIALKGNIHLTVLLAPESPIPDFGTGFSILAAVSLIETIDRIPGLEGRAGIKWVNDIQIDGAKIAGFLAHTLSCEGRVDRAILGIGLNVMASPAVSGDDYVPYASCLGNFISEPFSLSLSRVYLELLDRLEKNYVRLKKGDYAGILEIYRDRSVILGKNVTVFSDPQKGDPVEITHGKVRGIGDNLELFLEGEDRPVTRGRIILNSP